MPEHMSNAEKTKTRRRVVDEMIAANLELFTPVISPGEEEPCPDCGQVHDRFIGPAYVTEWVIVVSAIDAGRIDDAGGAWICEEERQGMVAHHVRGLLESAARRLP